MARYEWPLDLEQDDNRLHRAEYNLKRGNLQFGHMDNAALDIVNAEYSANDTPTWLPLGPFILLGGQANHSPMVSGRIRDLKVSDDGKRAYAGSGHGGVWYWTEEHGSWRPVGSGSCSIGALHVKFGTDIISDEVYAGTGELSHEEKGHISGRHHLGIGVLKLDSSKASEAINHPITNPWEREANNLTAKRIYRLAAQPDPTKPETMIAATSDGLYYRTGSFTDDQDWSVIHKSKFGYSDDDKVEFTDVVWDKDTGLWATAIHEGGRYGLFHAETFPLTGNNTFNLIDLPHIKNSWKRFAISPLIKGSSEPNSKYRLYVTGDKENRGTLWRVSQGLGAWTANEVNGIPTGIFGEQAFYNMAITARAVSNEQDKVYIGGQGFKIPIEPNSKYLEWNAALYEFSIDSSGNLEDEKSLGEGIHPDVHQVNLIDNELWVACDGGIFRKTLSDISNAKPMNVGFGAIEINYFDNHPLLDGPILAGTQDNGVIERIGDTVWHLRMKADGGGVAYHPTNPQFILGQYNYSHWQIYEINNEFSREELGQPISDLYESVKAQNKKRSNFYSRPSITVGVQGDMAQICIGTDRLLYCSNWEGPLENLEWVTIPSNKPAWMGKDHFDPFISVRIVNKGIPETYANGAVILDGVQILALSNTNLHQFKWAIDKAENKGGWTPKDQSIISGEFDKKSAPPALITKVSGSINYLPKPQNLFWTDCAAHDSSEGLGSCYVTTTGLVIHPNTGPATLDEKYDTLWWYNGNGEWYPTGLLSALSSLGVSASGHSAIVDPNDRQFVYVGTQMGVWRGEISVGSPTWTWEPFSQGLPQGIIEDLSFHTSPNNRKVLRASVLSRGIWEVDLDAASKSIGQTFLRSYNLDTGRRPIDLLEHDPYSKDPIDDPHAHSPDIIAFRQSTHNDLKEKWAAESPNEAEFLTFEADIKDITSARQRRLVTSTVDAAKANVAYVLVHHRDIQPIDKSKVTVHLFALKTPHHPWWEKPVPLKDIPLTNAMRNFIDNTINGTPPTPDPDDPILYLGAEQPDKNIDARMPRAAKFEFDLNFNTARGRKRDTVILIAVLDVVDMAPDVPRIQRLTLNDLQPSNLTEVTQHTSLLAAARFKRWVPKVSFPRAVASIVEPDADPYCSDIIAARRNAFLSMSELTIAVTSTNPPSNIAKLFSKISEDLKREDLLADNLQDRTLQTGVHTSSARGNMAYILVNYEGADSLDITEVAVHLFAWKNPPYDTDGSPERYEDLPLTPSIRQFIVNSAQGNPPLATSADPLLYLGSENPLHSLSDSKPRAVKFEFDLNYPMNIPRVEDTVILIAVIQSPMDTLQEDDLDYPNLAELLADNELVSANRFRRR